MAAKKSKPSDLVAAPTTSQSLHSTATQPTVHRAIVEGRIEEFATMMRDLTFKTGVTVKQKAAEWGITEQRGRELSAEASRRVRAELTDPDRIVVKVASSLEKVIDDALRETDEPALIDAGTGKDGEKKVYQESPNGARRVLIEAAKTLAVLTGANAPTKISVDVTKLSDEEVEARYQDYVRRLGAGNGEES